MSEKMAARQVTATCRDCGAVEQAAFAGPAYRCCGCAEKFASRIRRLADDGLNSYEIAAAVGISQTAVSRWCREFCIETYGLTTRKRKPSGQAGAFRGIGKKPADLMPSADALARASVWSFARKEVLTAGQRHLRAA